jgi:hypothetical protein
MDVVPHVFRAADYFFHGDQVYQAVELWSPFCSAFPFLLSTIGKSTPSVHYNRVRLSGRFITRP